LAATFDFDHLYFDKDNRAELEILKGKRIRRLVVYITRPADAQSIAACKSVDDLEIRGWKEPDLSTLKGLPIKRLRLVGGSQVSLNGLSTESLKFLWVQACGKLRELNIPQLPWLDAWASNNLDLDCLGSLPGLIVLDIGMRRAIHSLAFLRKCRMLKVLTIDTYAWKTRDFRPLIEAPALQIAGFTHLKRPYVEEISQANRKLMISGTNWYMYDGRPAAKEAYMKLRQAFNKRYG
jgi:hypothetical protein